MTHEEPSEKDAQGQVCWKGWEVSTPSPCGYTTLPEPPCFHHPEALQTLSFGDFMEASLDSHD